MPYKFETGSGLIGGGDLEMLSTMEVTCTPPSLQGGDLGYIVDVDMDSLEQLPLSVLLQIREKINTAIYDKERQPEK